MKMIKLWGLTVVLVYLPIICPTGDSTSGSLDAKAQDLTWGLFKRDKDEDDKIDSKISAILQEMKEVGMTRRNIQDFSPERFSTPFVRVNKQGEVQVYVYVTAVNEENVSKLKEYDLQVEIVNEKYKVVQGWLPFDKVDKVSELDFVVKITAPTYGTPRTGSVNTEGDSVLRSDEVRDTLGIDGSGVDVCVISDGVDNMASAQASGDLPDTISIDPSLPGSGDEGTAMLEIIYDIAPGANLFFSGPSTSLEMLESIEFCAGSSHVTVDDLGFPLEPYFEDGPVAEEARNAVEHGVVYVSAAGNEADGNHYQAEYVDTDPLTDANNHDFGLASGGGSQTLMGAGILPGKTAGVILQWNDPSLGDTVDGIGGSSNDYDLFIVPLTPNFQCNPPAVDLDGLMVCASIFTQDGDDDPIEAIVITNTSQIAPLLVNIVIDRFSGESRTLEMFISPTGVFLDFGVAEDSIFGHPAVSEVISVGAVPFDDPLSVEPFSSEGPSTIFFPAFEQRPKPDVVAPDRVSVTGAGGFGVPTAKSLFAGTSAAAPHVAGVAALILDANPSLTPSGVKDALTNTAIELGSVSVASFLNRDSVSGFGLVDAFAAVQSVLPQATPTPTPTPSPSPSPTPSPVISPQPTATPPPPGGGGAGNSSSSGGCAIAGPVKLGSALANILIPLIPALAIGVRTIRRIKGNCRAKEHSQV